MSIRLRLTLLYTAILALTLIAFSSILYASQTQTTYASIKAYLVGQATGFPRGERPPGPPPDQVEGASAPNVRPPTGLVAIDPFSGTLPGRWTQTRSITGTVTGSTPDLNGIELPLSQKGLESVQNGAGWYETAQVDSEPLLIYSAPRTTPNNVITIVQVAFPIAQPQHSLNMLRLVLIVGNTLAILLAFALGWVLAGTALRPIHRITQTAQAIGAERDFSHRVEHRGPTDEVGQLALTFNDMLAELESAYRQLEDALDSQRRFVADASHELRTPLTTVRGNIELLQRNASIAPEDARRNRRRHHRRSGPADPSRQPVAGAGAR